MLTGLKLGGTVSAAWIAALPEERNVVSKMGSFPSPDDYIASLAYESGRGRADIIPAIRSAFELLFSVDGFQRHQVDPINCEFGSKAFLVKLANAVSKIRKTGLGLDSKKGAKNSSAPSTPLSSRRTGSPAPSSVASKNSRCAKPTRSQDVAEMARGASDDANEDDTEMPPGASAMDSDHDPNEEY